MKSRTIASVGLACVLFGMAMGGTAQTYGKRDLSEADPPAAPVDQAEYVDVVQSDSPTTYTVYGTVVWTGPMPPQTPFEINRDQIYCAPEGTVDAPVEVDPETKALRDCFLWLTSDVDQALPPMAESPAMQRPERLLVRNCSIQPTLLVLPHRGRVWIVSDDDLYHEFAITKPRTGSVTAYLSTRSSLFELPLLDHGLYHLKGIRHGWARATIAVPPSRCWAVSGDAGSFAIRDVPAGEFTLHVWHRGLFPKPVVRLGVVENYDFSEDVLQTRGIRVPDDTNGPLRITLK